MSERAARPAYENNFERGAAVDMREEALEACRKLNGCRPGDATTVSGKVTLKATLTGCSGVAEDAALCLVAPLKILPFPPADHEGRGIAIEAIWGQVSTPR